MTGTFHLTIGDTSGAALDEDYPGEVARILTDLAARVAAGDIDPGERRPLRDVNGNTVGHWSVAR